MDGPSFARAGAAQLDLLSRAFKRADEKGYLAIIQKENDDARSDKHLYNFFAGGLSRWLDDWGLAHGRRCIVVHIWHHDDPGDLTFRFRVPKRRPFKPINIALTMMSKPVNYRRTRWADGDFTHIFGSDWIEYHGRTRAVLEIAVGVLEIPHHREILTGKFRNPAPSAEGA